MEVAVYGVLTGLWWMSSMTVLLPFLFLLKFSKYFRDKWFAFVFMKILKPVFDSKLSPLRKKAFELLKENLQQRNASTPLRILEIGIGSGANLQFYPENSYLTALDMNENFETHFNQNKEKYPQVTYERTVISMAENMNDIDDSSMDVVISTYVLCSVQCTHDVLKEIKRVLKPGGKFLFLEHVVHPDLWSQNVQKLADPLWQIYFDGCCLTRNINDDIKKAGFSEVICEKFLHKSLLLFIQPQTCGVAIK